MDDAEDAKQHDPDVRASFDFSEEEDLDCIDLRAHLTKEERAYEEERDRQIQAMQDRITYEDGEDEEDWEEDEGAVSGKVKALGGDEEQ